MNGLAARAPIKATLGTAYTVRRSTEIADGAVCGTIALYAPEGTALAAVVY